MTKSEEAVTRMKPVFGFRISDSFRISAFGLRIYSNCSTGAGSMSSNVWFSPPIPQQKL
jgi:hypothetical protein